MYNSYRVMRPLHLQPLETRLDVTDLVFLHNLVNGAIDYSALLAKIDFRIPEPTRSTDLSVQTFSITNYQKFGPMAGVQRWINFMGTEVDFFVDDLRVYKTKVLSSLNKSPNQWDPPLTHFPPYTRLPVLLFSSYNTILICYFLLYNYNNCDWLPFVFLSCYNNSPTSKILKNCYYFYCYYRCHGHLFSSRH